MKVILCGYNWIGCKVLDLLIESEFDIYVYTHENPPHVNSLVEFCQKRDIPYSTEKISIDNLPFKPDIIASIYYRYIISNDIIDFVEKRVFNLHPSLLPEYKGCSSITWAMIDGKNEIGFTYHYLTAKVDGGNIIIQKKIKMEDFDTQATIYNRVMFEAANYFIDTFNKVKNGIIGIKQSGLGNYYKRSCPFNGEIDPNWKEDKVERFIRAMNFPPMPYASLNNIEVKTFTDYKALIKIDK